MTAKLIADADETETDLTGEPLTPPDTVRHHADKEKLIATNSKCEDSYLFVKQSRSVRQNGLTTPEQRTFLQNSACLRDRENNGIARKEVIDIIVELCGATTHKKAENHLHELIRSGQLPDLKASVRVICAQNTTTKRFCIYVKHQLWSCMVVQFTWDELKFLNLPAE